MLAGVVTIQGDGLIADDTGGTVCRGRIDPMGIHVRFGTGDEESSGEMQHMEPGEIDIAPIHATNRAPERKSSRSSHYPAPRSCSESDPSRVP